MATLGPPPNSLQLMRKYLAYARTYCRPRVGGAAAAVLRQGALSRQLGQGHPLAARFATPAAALEALVPLAQARARLRLGEEVTREDAEDVLEILGHSLAETVADPAGMLLLPGAPTSKRAIGGGRGRGGRGSMAKRLLALASQRAAREGRASFSTDELLRLGAEAQIPAEDRPTIIQLLNDEGELLKKGPSTFALASG